jgi:hypothetical protein
MGLFVCDLLTIDFLQRKLLCFWVTSGPAVGNKVSELFFLEGCGQVLVSTEEIQLLERRG